MAEKHREDSLHDDDVGRKNSILHAEVLTEPELMSGAYLAEEREHNQSLWVSRGIIEQCYSKHWG
jgi:hypothetical protein